MEAQEHHDKLQVTAKMRVRARLLLLAWGAIFAAHATVPPLMSMRLRRPHTESDAQWTKTFKILRENRGACDEVWFSTGVGFPEMAWHEAHAARLVRYAEDLRTAGIIPSLQFQATLGHSDVVTAFEGAFAKTWGGFVGRTGAECKLVGCPRQAALLAYLREVAERYAAFRPGSVWFDGDLRIAGHGPASPWNREKEGWIGCWCTTCIAAFNAETGGTWTRETLDAAMATGSALYDRWERFSFESIAAVARVIVEEMHRVSPDTHFGYQHAPHRNDCQLIVFKALREASGHPVGSRPGGGAYFDFDPHAQNVKAVLLARQRRCIGERDWIDVWCPEIDTYPRAFSSRTAQGILNECLVNLALGMNALSLLVMDTRFETDEWYGENLLRPIAEAREMLEAYRTVNADAIPAGLADRTGLPPRDIYRYALAGIPVLFGPGKAFGEIVAADISEWECADLETRGYDVNRLSSSAICDLRRRMDERSGGTLPVRVETPSIGLVVPRVTVEGTLRSVVFANARIGIQKPICVRLRGVPPTVTTVVWRAFNEKSTTLPLKREGADALVTIPALAAWNYGWLGF